jgi:hypothetical protein
VSFETNKDFEKFYASEIVDLESPPEAAKFEPAALRSALYSEFVPSKNLKFWRSVKDWQPTS